jgi:hypothetical protein
MSNISPQKNARIPEQNISLRNRCKNFWLEETAILDMQMSKLPMISGYDIFRNGYSCDRKTFEVMTSTLPIGSLGSVAS